MNKVYVVEGSSGSYEDFDKFIIAVCTSPIEANVKKQLFQAKIGEFKNRYSIKEREKLDEEIEEIEDNIAFNYWPQRLKDYHKWEFGSSLSDVNSEVIITEVELNKMVFKFD